jgi:4-hydroxy-tetrahydrodipicolinate synthase
MNAEWHGVYPAVTTQLRSDQSIDLEATAAHVEMLIRAGVHGLIMLGGVGENFALAPDEKRAVLKTTVEAVAGRVPLLSGLAENATASACQFAADAEALGVDGLMVLPARSYRSDGRETLAYYRELCRASDLPIMCYNDPVSDGVDVTPEMFAELADEPTLVAIKESSDDTRRFVDLANACGDRYLLFCGVDDLLLESVLLGATGWVAGLVNAFPEESLRLWDLAVAGRWDEARDLYRWFMPLLHLDDDVKLVQYIKLAQAMCGLGSEHVRAPRMMLAGAERERVIAVIQAALDSRPRLAAA